MHTIFMKRSSSTRWREEKSTTTNIMNANEKHFFDEKSFDGATSLGGGGDS